MSNDILQRGIGYCKQTLRWLVDSYGLTAVQEEIARQPDFAAIVNEIMGGVAEPVPTSALTPWHVQNNQIYFNNKVWKGLGMNFRELAFYGLGIDPIKWAQAYHVPIQLDGAVSKDCSVIRVYCSHHQVGVDQAIPRIRHILDEAEKRGLFVILVLTDGAPPSAWYVADTATNRQNGYTWEWIREGFKTGAYWQYVDAVTKALGSHNAVWSFEPINEIFAPSYPLTPTQSEWMLNFWTEIAALIRQNAPTKMISTGNVSCWENFVLDAYGGGKFARKLAMLPTVDIMTFHSYPIRSPDPNNPATKLGETWQHIIDELNVLQGVGKVAFIIEESAQQVVPNIETSPDPIKWQGEEAFARGIAMIMLWGVSFPYNQDIGVGDGFFNGQNPPWSTRWDTTINGWFVAIANQFKQLYS